VSSSLLTRNLRREYPHAVRGEGALLFDSSGKQYIDFSGSAAVNLIGHGVPEIADAMASQARRLEFVHSSQFVTDVAEQFAAELLDFCGSAFSGGRVFFTSGGSESVETALKLARQFQVESGHRARFKIAARRQSYHGATLGALAVSGNRKRREIFLPMVAEDAAFPKVSIPYCYRCKYGCNRCGAQYARELEELLASDSAIAAFIAEPISGATLGAAVAPDDYLPRIAATCRAHGALFIADEVMTGIGRTGKALAADHWSVDPDIVVLAKGLSSGYVPLGACMVRKHVADAIAAGSGALMHGFTYNNHPISMAAGLAVLQRTRGLGEKWLLPAISDQHPTTLLADALASLRSHPHVGDVRGLGLLWGVEFVRDKQTKEPFDPKLNIAAAISEECMKRGVLVYPMQGCMDGISGDHLLIAPPAVITPEQITQAVVAVAAAITSAAR
jgi:adenosylmethionine-8-amino-7-oxononanoate aminotransferase